MQPYDQGWGQPQPQQQGGWGQPQGFGGPQTQWAPGQPMPSTLGQQQPQAPAGPTPPSADDFLTGGHRSAKFDTFGSVIGGQIVEAPRVEQQTDPKTRVPQFYPSGDPKWVLLVSVQAQPGDGDDDGVRTFYVKADMKRAVQKAVAQAGRDRLEIGAVLQVRYVRDEPNSSGSGLPKKVYEARYQPPGGQAGATPPVQTAVAPPAAATSPAFDDVAPF